MLELHKAVNTYMYDELTCTKKNSSHSWDILFCTTQECDLNFFRTCMHMVQKSVWAINKEKSSHKWDI